MNTPEEYQQAGEALLATVFHLMTGNEIEALEWTQSEEFEDDLCCYESTETQPGLSDFIDEYETSRAAIEAGTDRYMTALEEWEDIKKRREASAHLIQFLKSLAIQFSREIADYINLKNTAAAIAAVETHNRLHPN